MGIHTVFWDNVIGWLAMQHVSFDLPKNEWLRIMAAARQTWPDDKLSNAEILRRCVVLGVPCLQYLSPESSRQFVAIYRNYQPPFDGAARLTTPIEPEGDHP
jgi:hypothetical protein